MQRIYQEKQSNGGAQKESNDAHNSPPSPSAQCPPQTFRMTRATPARATASAAAVTTPTTTTMAVSPGCTLAVLSVFALSSFTCLSPLQASALSSFSGFSDRCVRRPRKSLRCVRCAGVVVPPPTTRADTRVFPPSPLAVAKAQQCARGAVPRQPRPGAGQAADADDARPHGAGAAGPGIAAGQVMFSVCAPAAWSHHPGAPPPHSSRTRTT